MGARRMVRDARQGSLLTMRSKWSLTLRSDPQDRVSKGEATGKI